MSIAIDPSVKIVEFKGGTIPAVRLHLGTIDVARLAEGFADALGRSPGFFDGELAVADLGAIGQSDGSPDWPAIRTLCAEYGLRLAAVSNPGTLEEGARAEGLAVLSLPGIAVSRAAASPGDQTIEDDKAHVATEPNAPGKAPAAARTPATLILERPLRSGQQVYGRGCDVVLLALASAGSEIIADGNVHVYAPLRGRALAGAQGDFDARIITTCFEPELVSIAGIFQTFEDGIPAALARQPVQVRLSSSDPGEPRLVIEPLSIG